MGAIYDSSQPDSLQTGLRLARAAIGRGELVVLPTDTVYGVAADAFNAEAVVSLVTAKGRTPASPPPVLIGNLPALDALAEEVHDEVRALAARFWPGALTIIVPARASLDLDLGETRGSVALRMPDDPIALELLRETGPLAVSSANRTGEPPASTAAEAQAALGEAVAVILDGGERGAVASTIVDATALPGGRLRIVRAGAIGAEDIRAIVGADRLDDPAAGTA
ncbi:MAG TPA: L-threonylcarbamoyladenylate synthase [Microbacteriaceae bacterium]|nr:L-threonylcarbamoyladenylate synthase [Microbacteriaceae bacterium]